MLLAALTGDRLVVVLFDHRPGRPTHHPSSPGCDARYRVRPHNVRRDSAVYSIEASSENVQCARETARLNSMADRITIKHAIVGEPGTIPHSRPPTAMYLFHRMCRPVMSFWSTSRVPSNRSSRRTWNTVIGRAPDRLGVNRLARAVRNGSLPGVQAR